MIPPLRERLKAAISYNPDTGELTWRSGPHRGHSVRVNDTVHGRRRLRFEGIRYTATHIIFYYMEGRWPKREVDHINGVIADDRWCNLREATRTENARNTKGYARSGYKGVYTTLNGKFQAMIRDSGRTRPLGTFDTPEEAYAAYCAVARQLHGAFFNGGTRDT